MTDVVDEETRRRMMSGIRCRNTKPEIQIRKQLFKLGFRYRIHDRNLPGKPDIVLKKYHATILVNGCFWHRHNCHLFKWPTTRAEFWHKKLNENHENDLRKIEQLKMSGWRVCIVWECSIKGSLGKIVTVGRELECWLKDISNIQLTKEISE